MRHYERIGKPLGFYMKIFLSSTYEDLIGHREVAARAIERLGQQGIRMEVFGARPLEATSACLVEISGCDALIGIYAHRYGFVPHGQLKSITEQEYDFAIENKKPTFCFVVDGDYPWPPKFIEEQPGRQHLQTFLKRIQATVVTEVFTNPDDLAFKVASSLGRFLLYRKIKDELEKIPARDSVSTDIGRSQVARRAARSKPVIQGASLLLVNDVPEQMSHVIEIMRDLEIDVHVETSSEGALRALSDHTYDVVVSDMERYGIQDDGIYMLNQMRSHEFHVPLIFTIGRFNPSLGTPPFAFGVTNRVDECLNLVFDALERMRG